MNLGSKSESRVPRLKVRLKETTQRAILEAAEEIFARDGIERARIDAIAAQAGVSVGSIYNHIGDRDAVFHAVLDLRRAEILEALETAAEASAPSGVAAGLEALARTMLEHVDRHRGFFAIVLESAEGPRRLLKPPETVTVLQARVKQLLRRGVRDGTLRSDLGGAYGVLFVGMLRAAIRERIADPDGPSPARWSRSVVSLFLEGAAARKASR